MAGVVVSVVLMAQLFQAPENRAAQGPERADEQQQQQAEPGGQSKREPGRAAGGQEGQIEQGRYLVHHVAKCIECHTPRDASGRLVRQRLLQGARIPISSPYPNQEWAFQAPALAGLPGWAKEDIVHLLMHGERPSGIAPRPPMPAFQMKREDAEAVVAYLKSL